jgi:two-component system LytT family response regulator
MVQVIGEADGVDSGILMIREHQPQVVFLDIQMQDGSGFDLLKEFPEPNFQVVFVTAYDNFAIAAFEFNAVDYLLKPIDTPRLVRAVTRLAHVQANAQYFGKLSNLLTNIQQNRLQRITLQTQERQHYVTIDQIIRLQSENNYTTFHLEGGKKIMVSETIKRYEELLPAQDFFRTHQSHIVQRKHVGSFVKSDGGSIEMADGFLAPVSRRKREAFFAWIKEVDK